MPVRWAGSALSFGSVMTASMRPWDPPTQVKSESMSVAANHRRSAGHRRCGAGSSSSLDEPVVGSVAPQWPTSSRWPRKSMYSRLGIRTFGPARTLAGNHGEMPRAGSPCIPETARPTVRGNNRPASSSGQPGGVKRASPIVTSSPQGSSRREPVRERRVGLKTQHPGSVFDSRQPAGRSSPSPCMVAARHHQTYRLLESDTHGCAASGSRPFDHGGPDGGSRRSG